MSLESSYEDIIIKEISEVEFIEWEHPRDKLGRFTKKLGKGGKVVSAVVSTVLASGKKISKEKIKKVKDSIEKSMMAVDEEKINSKKVGILEEVIENFHVDHDTKVKLHHLVNNDLKNVFKHAPLKTKIKKIFIRELDSQGEYECLTNKIHISKDLSTHIRRKDFFITEYIDSLKFNIKMIKKRNEGHKKYLDKLKKYSISGTQPSNIESFKSTKTYPSVKIAIEVETGYFEHSKKILMEQETAMKNIIKNKNKITPFNSTDYAKSEAEGVMIHEYAHAWHFDNEDLVLEKFDLGPYTSDESPSLYNEVTKYAQENDPECFAENFTAYFCKRTDRMHRDAVKIFNELFPEFAKKNNYFGIKEG